MKILTREQIEKLLSIKAVLKAVEEGFILYSRDETVIPPVGLLHFNNPPGDCHIKYGYAKEGKYYVVKVASGFPGNPEMGIPSNNGLMLLFCKNTGTLVSVLLDEGYLTDIRTAAAGAICAKHLAPKNITAVGIIGTGAQAYYQLKLLEFGTTCRRAILWGRDPAKTEKLKHHPDLRAWHIDIATDINQLTASCNLIVTTTSSRAPLLFADQIQPGTHITAIGADDIGKQELDAHLFTKATHIIVDSLSQCTLFGDTSYALHQNLISPCKLTELGTLIQSPITRSPTDITIADLTGLAIQDLQIATTLLPLNPSHK